MKRIILAAILLLPALFACTDNSGNGKGSATDVVLSRDNINIIVGETATITATVLPESLGMGVVWSVLDDQYADVKDGVITGKAEGVTYVVATSADGYQKAACMVSVNPPIRYSVTINNEYGMPLSELYGYPGMLVNLSASTSDGEVHRFTWSVDDEAAGTVSQEGRLMFGASPSTDAAYVFDASSYVRVVTEEDFGTKIPIRSSLLNGLQLGDYFNSVGTPIMVEENGSYPIAVLYEGEYKPLSVPADDVKFELSNTGDFSIVKEGNQFKLITGAKAGVSTKLSVIMPGSADKIEVAEIVIDKEYPITASFVRASSSTLSFTWTEKVSVDDDISKPYTVYLYKNEDCTELEASFSIPAGDGCWKSRQPRYVFSGLVPGTQYWFKVVDTTSGDSKESAVISATTEEFHIVMVSSEPASEGDIILAEDFGQMCWGADEISQSAGYDVGGNSSSSYMSRSADSFVGTTGSFAQRQITEQKSAIKESGLRIAKWAQGYYNRLYVGPGYIFLSTYKYGVHLITPALNNIPEGALATLKITFHAAGYVAGSKAVMAVQHGTSFYEISSGTQTNKDKVNLTSNVQKITFTGGITNLEEFEVTLEGVVKGDRIAFGPEAEKKETNSNMMLISDMTIKILELL